MISLVGLSQICSNSWRLRLICCSLHFLFYLKNKYQFFLFYQFPDDLHSSIETVRFLDWAHLLILHVLHLVVQSRLDLADVRIEKLRVLLPHEVGFITFWVFPFCCHSGSAVVSLRILRIFFEVVGNRVSRLVGVGGVTFNWGDTWKKLIWESGAWFGLGYCRTFAVPSWAAPREVRHPGLNLRQCGLPSNNNFDLISSNDAKIEKVLIFAK